MFDVNVESEKDINKFLAKTGALRVLRVYNFLDSRDKKMDLKATARGLLFPCYNLT